MHLSLPCSLFRRSRESYLRRALVSIFSVAKIFTVRFYLCAWQRNLYRAGAHDKERLHIDAYFSRSDLSNFKMYLDAI
jgi:hypothetical protein